MICPPCPPKEEFTIRAIPKMVCEPCPVESVPELKVFGKYVKTTTSRDCFPEMLRMMTSTKFCNVGPQACG